LHEMQFFIIIPPWNSGWHEIVKHIQLSGCVCVCVCVCTYVYVYEAWSKSIWTDAVKLTKLNLPSGWTNHLQSRPHLFRYNYSSGLSAAGRTSHFLFWRSLKLLHCIKFNHFHNFISFTCQGFLNSEGGDKVTWGHVCGIQGLTYLWNVMFAWKLLFHCHQAWDKLLQLMFHAHICS
jgi:hypothetical protein